MTEALAETIWTAVMVYAGIGALLALYLLSFGLSRLDGQAARAPLHVKALWAPGLIALWPVLIPRVFGVQPPEDRS